MILFVCTGNTCRSPMAAALLAHHLGAAHRDLAVTSAGTLGWSGRPATTDAIDVLADRGIDLSRHVSRRLTRELVLEADLVVAMTRVHAGAVIARSDEAEARTFLVGELARLADGRPRAVDETVRSWAARLSADRVQGRPLGRAADEVDDPLGEPRRAYERTVGRLDAHLRTIADRLSP